MTDRDDFDPELYPVRVVLGFRSEAERDYVLGQLSDGWGESYIDFDWPWKDGIEMAQAEVLGVLPSEDELAEMRRHEELDRKFRGEP